jgi:transposase
MKQRNVEEVAIGIDISKAYFDVAYEKNGVVQHQRFSNNKVGFRSMKKWLRKRKISMAHFAMEATGRYGLPLAKFLHAQGYAVSIVNPRQIKAYRESWLIRNKTDAADALLIAAFCRERELLHWQPPAPEVEALQNMERRKGMLQKMKTMEINRLKSGKQASVVEASIKRTLRHLDKEIARIEQEMEKLTQRHASIQNEVALLTSIPGVGDHTAFLLIGEVKDITYFSSGPALAAYAGVTARIHESGDTVRKKPKMSKVGNARLRAGLYFSTMSAMQHNPVIKTFAQRLKAQGKPGKVILIACMRKLLHIIYGVWRSGKPFDPEYEQRLLTSST